MSYRDYYGGYSRGYRRADDQIGAYSDWDRSGGGCCCGGGGYGGETSLFSDGTLFALLAGAALAFYVLYTTLTAAAASKRRRRSFPGVHLDDEEEHPLLQHFGEILGAGLEEFEEKIDKIAEGEDDGENSWISKIYNQFSFFNDGQNSLEENDMDGLEPPILDETWGLGLRNAAKDITANTTLEEPVEILDLKLEDKMENTKTKREAVDENDEEANEEDTEEKCRVDMWRCLSKVIEGGLHYMDKPEGLMGLAKKTMFKVAFHGGFNNVWNGVMTIPEARQIKHCMTEHTECVSYEILRREAQQTLDPNDPMLDMYERQRAEKKANKVEEVENKKRKKKERLIVNPEFVEALDSGDGSVQYDEDYDRQNEV